MHHFDTPSINNGRKKYKNINLFRPFFSTNLQAKNFKFDKCLFFIDQSDKARFTVSKPTRYSLKTIRYIHDKILYFAA